jgi:mRNA interferase RelE/StbE
LVWQIEFDPAAKKELRKLDPQIAKRILKFLKERLATQVNPRKNGEALKGSTLGEFWKYRVGDFRILRIGNRKEIYK